MFRTEVKLKPSLHKIGLEDPVLTMGSCFAQNIGDKLLNNKFKVASNPFGTLFNPFSVFRLMNKAILGESLDAAKVVENEELYHHFDLHSDLSSTTREGLLTKANHQLQRVGEAVKSSSYIIYTFGTSIVYEFAQTGEMVANCHKLPAYHFKKRFLEVDEIVRAFKNHYDLVKQTNEDIRFIMTVSPVRHQKESFERNNVSKSILRVAIEKILGTHTDVQYFPAFEIMMDELRDYRFYADDMLHPNRQGVDFIWDKFSEIYFNEATRSFIQRWEKVMKALSHRPINPESKHHQAFIAKTISQLNEFVNLVDVQPEIDHLKSQLK